MTRKQAMLAVTDMLTWSGSWWESVLNKTTWAVRASSPPRTLNTWTSTQQKILAMCEFSKFQIVLNQTVKYFICGKFSYWSFTNIRTFWFKTFTHTHIFVTVFDGKSPTKLGSDFWKKAIVSQLAYLRKSSNWLHKILREEFENLLSCLSSWFGLYSKQASWLSPLFKHQNLLYL